MERRTGEDDVGVGRAGVVETRRQGREGEAERVEGGGRQGMGVCQDLSKSKFFSREIKVEKTRCGGRKKGVSWGWEGGLLVLPFPE